MKDRMAYIELDTVEDGMAMLESFCQRYGVKMELIHPAPNPGIPFIKYTGKHEDLVTMIAYYFDDASGDLSHLTGAIHNIEPDKNDLARTMGTILEVFGKFDCTEVYVEDGNPYIQIVGDSLECLGNNPYHKIAFRLMPTFVDDYDITDWRQMYINRDELDSPQIKQWIVGHDLIVLETNNPPTPEMKFRVIGTFKEMDEFFAECFDISSDLHDYIEPIAMN